LCYVQPTYRFEPGDGEREVWQVGVELFGLAAPEADAELLALARALLESLGLRELRFELSHAALIRAVLAAAGLDAAAQAEAYDRLLDGEDLSALPAVSAELAPALRLLTAVDGGGMGYLENLSAALRSTVPSAVDAIEQLAAATRALDAA